MCSVHNLHSRFNDCFPCFVILWSSMTQLYLQNLLCTSLRHCSFLYTQHEGTDDFCTIFEMFDVCKVLKPPRCCLLVYFDKLR